MNDTLLLGIPMRRISDHADIGMLVGRTNGGDLLIQVGFWPFGKIRAMPADEWEPIPPTAWCPYCGEQRNIYKISGDKWQCCSCGHWWLHEDVGI